MMSGLIDKISNSPATWLIMAAISLYHDNDTAMWACVVISQLKVIHNISRKTRL